MSDKTNRFILFKFFGKGICYRVSDLSPELYSYLTMGLGAKVYKLTPVKSESLCLKCIYNKNRICAEKPLCKGCERFLKSNEGYCKCRKIKTGTPCPDFVRADEEPPEFEVIHVADTNERFTVSGTIKDKPMIFEEAIEELEKYQDLLPLSGQIAVNVIRNRFEYLKYNVAEGKKKEGK